MPLLKKLLSPKSYARFIWNRVLKIKLSFDKNYRGVALYAPGHFCSPLLDIESLDVGDVAPPFDGFEMWEHVNLRHEKQLAYYEDLVGRFGLLSFPSQKTDDFLYFSDNNWFTLADAFTLSGILQKEKPRRIVEVGSGFSSAVMIDTLRHFQMSSALTFIEPYPDRLLSLLKHYDKSSYKIIAKRVQEIELSVFEELEAQDIVFIDSSHVAKIGSDVAHILLRILPRLKPGVLVHFHDVFYPFSYPIGWIREGRAWNESLFLRAFLVGNRDFEVLAFNSYAGRLFPEVFLEKFPAFLGDTGGSIWLRKVEPAINPY